MMLWLKTHPLLLFILDVHVLFVYPQIPNLHRSTLQFGSNPGTQPAQKHTPSPLSSLPCNHGHGHGKLWKDQTSISITISQLDGAAGVHNPLMWLYFLGGFGGSRGKNHWCWQILQIDVFLQFAFWSLYWMPAMYLFPPQIIWFSCH